MSSIELTTPRDMTLEYFGTLEWNACADLLDQRVASHKASAGFLDQACDMSLFPYEAQGPFETPLPTLLEISAQVAAKTANGNGSIPDDVETVHIGRYMVKLGVDIGIFQEAENLIYLERNSSVQTPKVYAAFASQDADPAGLNERNKALMTSLGSDEGKTMYYYIIMEYIDGSLLADIGKDLHGPPLYKVARLLGEQLQKLRSVPAEHPELYGRVGGKAFPVYPSAWYPPAPDFNDYGPFDYATLLDRLEHTGKLRIAVAYAPSEDREIFNKARRLYPKARYGLLDNLEMEDRRPVLSNAEIGTNNIVAKLVRDDEGKIVDVTEVVLTDWKSMCWMPAWFEAAECRELEYSTIPLYEVIGSTCLEVMGHVEMAAVNLFTEMSLESLYTFG